MSRFLIAGLPRSGSTWLAEMLARTQDTELVFEPDNHRMFPFAFKGKVGLPGGYYPRLSGEEVASHYERLWSEAFGGAGTTYDEVERARRKLAHRLLRRGDQAGIRRAFTAVGLPAARLRVAGALAVPERPSKATRHVVVKSVYAALSLEWIQRRTGARVVILSRDVRRVVASWLRLGWLGDASSDDLAALGHGVRGYLAGRHNVAVPDSANSPLARTTWLMMALTRELEDAAHRNGWFLVHHEELASGLPQSLRTVAEQLDLHWSGAAEEALERSRTAGEGFELARTPDQLEQAWKRPLTAGDAEVVESVVSLFGPGLRA